MAPELLILLGAAVILQADLLPDKKCKCHLLNSIIKKNKYITKKDSITFS